MTAPMTPERLAEIRSSVERTSEWSAFLSEIDRRDLLTEVDRLNIEGDELLRRAKVLADEKIAAEAEVDRLRAQVAAVTQERDEWEEECDRWREQVAFMRQQQEGPAVVLNPGSIGNLDETPIVQLPPAMAAAFERTRCPQCGLINQAHSEECAALASGDQVQS